MDSYRTAFQPALRAAPRFYQRSHRDGVTVAATTRLCFVSRAAAGVTVIRRLQVIHAAAKPAHHTPGRFAKWCG